MKNITTYETAMCGIMTALMCIAGPLAVPIGPIPVTLIVLVLFFALMVTGTKLTMISFTAYLLLGAAGLPVFSGYAGGAAKLAGPTGGYLIGFLFMIPIAGAFRRRYADRPVLTGCGMLLGLAAAYFFGNFRPMTFLIAAAIFCYFRTKYGNTTTDDAKLIDMSKCMLGVYLVHPMFIKAFYGLHLSILVPHPIVTAPLMAVVFFGLSLFVVRMFRKIPGMRKIL